MHFRTILLSTTALIFAVLAQAKPHDDYRDEILATMPATHPRLFITSGILERMKMDAREKPLIRDGVNRLYEIVEGYPDVINEETYKTAFYGHDKFGDPAARAAFAFLLSGKQAYANKGIAILEVAAQWYSWRYAEGKPVGWTSFSRVSALCAYDWLYSQMTPEQRVTIGKELIAHIKQSQDHQWIVESGLQNKGEGTNRPTSSFYGTAMLPWYAGIVFYSDGLDDAFALRMLDKGLKDYMTMLSHRNEMAGDDGGGANSSPGYSFGDAVVTEWYFFYTWRAITGRNIAEEFPGIGLLPHWVLYAAIVGADGQLYEHGTGGSWHYSNKLTMNLRYLAQYKNFFPDSPCGKIVDYFIYRSEEFRDNAHVYASPLWRHKGYLPLYLFFYNYSKAADYKYDRHFFEKLPRACLFENLGQTYMNSGWEPGSTYAMFTCGAKSGSHKQHDENHFVIYKGGFLALDSGSRSASGYKDWLDDMWHDSNYYCRSVAHNMVTIRMEGEKWQGWPDPEYAVANNAGTYKTTGGIVRAFETNRHYTYVAGDSTACYRPEKARKVLRQFVYIMPDLFVIYDTVESVTPEQVKTWLLHSQNEPQVNGDTFSFDENRGRLFCRTFLPRKWKRETIGGAGKEFWVDGKNYPLGNTRLEEIKEKGIKPIWGNWRVELRAEEPTAKVTFLNLIQVGMADKLGKMVESSYVRDGEREGVKVTHDGVEYTVLFDTEDAPRGSIKATSDATELFANELTKRIQEEAAF